MPPPLLVVVTGPPGSGTSTLAHKLGRTIPCPVVSRDEIKEGLVATVDGYEPELGDRAAQRTLDIFFAAMAYYAGAGVSTVAESSFQHQRWAPGLEPLLAGTRARVVRCHVTPETARERIAERAAADESRLRVHGDPSLGLPFSEFAEHFAAFRPLALDVPTLDVDTTDGYAPAFDRILAFAR